MKRLIASFAVVVCFVLAPDAGAQVIVEGGEWASTPVAVRGTYPTFYVVPYSYYAAIPFAARGYVSYGADEFPYYGRPYGSPSDPWTWPYMSGSYYYGVLARYYYPPVP